MPITNVVRKGLMTAGALGALALGGSQLADAATSHSSSASAGGSRPSVPAAGRPHRDPTVSGGHVGANGQTEKALASDAAAKVRAAAEAKVPGGTVERVETDADHGSPYEAHVRKSDGTELEVLVDSSFNVTAVNTMGPR